MRNHVRLDPTTNLEDAFQLTFQENMFQEFARLRMIHSSLSLERQDIFGLFIIKRIHQKKSSPFCPEKAEQLS